MIAGFPAEDSLFYLRSPESGPPAITYSRKVLITSNFVFKQAVLCDLFSIKFEKFLIIRKLCENCTNYIKKLHLFLKKWRLFIEILIRTFFVPEFKQSSVVCLPMKFLRWDFSDNLKLTIFVNFVVSFSNVPSDKYCPKRPNRPYNTNVNIGIFFKRNRHLFYKMFNEYFPA